ncbi:MAG TPA: hypothetical protein VGN93_11900 [Shinella sp.]|jgi:hypothetical protein|uniref:flagellar biosynthetic protein FliO n=1 Tax=Shinella sp. TaxID=1870904 RepID=UPI002E164BF3|nr:hypothetical protein [Shinella sp.]
MFQEILAENGTKFVIAAVVVLLGLLCLALVLWIIRGRPSSPFIRGGRNRTPRLAVLDAAAIDTRRRLVLVRRDDVEHLLMIGGPTDIVVETRIATASGETAQPAEKAIQPVIERAEPAPVLQEVPARAAETAVAARSAASSSAASTTAGAVERRPVATPEGVSAMARVLYAGDDEGAARAVPVRTATQPMTTNQQANVEQRSSERRIEDVLEQSRQRVLSPQSGTTTSAQATTGQGVQRPVTTPVLAKPTTNIADNPALVSEFEKILEAEMASNAASSSAARTSAQPTSNPTQTAAMSGQAHAQPSAKSREETEAEMARLLGEIAANRKA